MSIDFSSNGVNTLWGSFEVKNTRLLQKMLHQYSGKPLPVTSCAATTTEALNEICDEFEKLPLYFMNFRGASDVKAVIDAMEHAVYVHDVEHIILDNLQFMLDRSVGGDKFEAQDLSIMLFRKFATEKNVHVTLVCHPRKEEEGGKLGINSFFGSAKATQEADNVLILQYDGRSRKHLEVKKNRYDGTLGISPLFFDMKSGNYREEEVRSIDGAEGGNERFGGVGGGGGGLGLGVGVGVGVDERSTINLLGKAGVEGAISRSQLLARARADGNVVVGGCNNDRDEGGGGIHVGVSVGNCNVVDEVDGVVDDEYTKAEAASPYQKAMEHNMSLPLADGWSTTYRAKSVSVIKRQERNYNSMEINKLDQGVYSRNGGQSVRARNNVRGGVERAESLRRVAKSKLDEAICDLRDVDNRGNE